MTRPLDHWSMVAGEPKDGHPRYDPYTLMLQEMQEEAIHGPPSNPGESSGQARMYLHGAHAGDGHIVNLWCRDVSREQSWNMLCMHIPLQGG